LKRQILTGIRYGLRAWLAYGIVEFVLAYAIPVLFQRDVELLPWQWRPIGLVFGVYVLFGVALGSAGGILLAWTERQRTGSHAIMAALTFTAAFAVNLVAARPLNPSEYIAAAVALLLAASFAGALAWTKWLERTAFLANPWALSLLLLTWPWVSHGGLGSHSRSVTTGASLVLFGGTVVLAAMWQRLRSGQIGLVGRRAVMASASILLLGMVLVSGTRCAVPAIQASDPSAGAKCNVLLITMDTVRADHLSVYGYERGTTPNLKDFAREATVYGRAVAAADMTLPAHASMFTGLYPGWHGAYVVQTQYPQGRPLSYRYTTLADLLHSHDYSTGAVTANGAFFQRSMGLTKGFAEYHLLLPVRVSGSGELFYLREGARRLLSLAVDTSSFEGTKARAADVNRGAFAFLAHVKDRGPFFLFLNYMDAHMPYVPPAPFNAMFPGKDLHFRPFSEHLDLIAEVNSGRRHISAGEERHLVSQYDGGIAYLDSEIGNLLSRLRELGVYENTLIIITSDHGEAFGEHDLLSHGLGFVYQDQIHVPLLIKYPGQHVAQLSDDLVSQVDLMPTVLDGAGISPPSDLQGRSLRLPRTKDAAPVYSQAEAMGRVAPSYRRFRGVRHAMFIGSWKLITWTEGAPELYDLAADPDETHNFYRADDPHDKALADRLSAWVAAAPQKFEEPAKLDKSSFEKLKSLGYAQ
jgi:arylsulfatase A-like enzyme